MKKPFFAYLGPHAPHYSADAPPWAQTLFSDMRAPRTPAYNTSVGQADKTLHVAQNPPINEEMETMIDQHFRDRWRSIVGVDDMIRLIWQELETLDVLSNTYIFYSSEYATPNHFLHLTLILTTPKRYLRALVVLSVMVTNSESGGLAVRSSTHMNQMSTSRSLRGDRESCPAHV